MLTGSSCIWIAFKSTADAKLHPESRVEHVPHMWHAIVRVHMQAAGLKYYDDLQHRIPRMEVAAIEAVVKEAVVDMLHCREAHDASTLFCCAVGR